MAPTYRRFSHEAAWIISLFALAAILLLTSPAHGTPPSTVWNNAFGANATDDAISVATDASGNVYVVGYFSGTIDVGGGPLVSAGLDDVFIASYSPTGVHRWSQRFGGAGTDRATALDVRASRVAITGYFNDTIYMGGGWITPAGGNDVFVYRLDTDGNYFSCWRTGGTGNDAGQAIAITADDGYVLVGGFTGTGMFWYPTPWESAGDVDVFVGAYRPGMSIRWGKHFGSTARDEAKAVVIDHDGNIIIAGEFGGAVDFGGGPISSTNGSQDILLTKFTNDGDHVWSKGMGGTGSDRAFSVAVDASNNILACGNCNASVDLGGGALPYASNFDTWLAKYDSSGNHLWSNAFGGGFTDMAYAVATDAAGNVYMTGFMCETVDFGTGDLVSNGGGEMFIAKYNPAGVPQWSTCFGSTDYDRGRDIATDAAGNVVVAGDFVGTVDFGKGPVTGPGNNSTDAVVLKLGAVATGAGHVQTPTALSVSTYPNPFNPRTTVNYAVPSRGNVTLSIYDTHGTRVATLVNNQPRAAGAYREEWNGLSDNGSVVASGVYFARLEHASGTVSKKMVLLK